MEGRMIEYNTIFAKSFSRYEQKKLSYGAIITSFIVTLSLFCVLKPSLTLLPIMNLRLSMHSGQTMLMIEDTNSSQPLGESSKVKLNSQPGKYNEVEVRNEITEMMVDGNVQSVGISEPAQNISSTDGEGTIVSKTKNEIKLVCNFSDPRSDFCEIYGDIRIHGKSSTVFFSSTEMEKFVGNKSWKIRPYARKGDITAMGFVNEFSVKLVHNQKEARHCTLNHSIPAIIFSTGGYAGNNFHDFSDILIPLFLTSRQFNGEVQFLITNAKSFWISKYQVILKQLSRYEIIKIDEDKDDEIHCFPSIIIGLKHHKYLSIDPSKSPNGYSIEDFTQFLRNSYSLRRVTAMQTGDRKHKKKPRLLIISRKKTRSFTNKGQIVKMAKRLGYEVVVFEPKISTNLSGVAQIVNSCDVMMGVHGAGLTNLVFLPSNAILIQIAPLGGMEWLCRNYFGEPALDMNIRYLEYKIREEESSLIEQYPLDHAVIKDPFSISKQGWGAFKSIYLDKQNIKLDVDRFRATLLEALELLHH